MGFDGKSLDDYNTVAERLEKFRADHPEGRIRPADPAMPYHVVRVPNSWCVRCKGAQVVKAGQQWKDCPRCQGTGLRAEGEPHEDVFIVYSASVYRDAGDTEPGVGMAWEQYPGRTPYTAGSELMNAETSAWGRALIAANAADARKGVATAEDIRNREADEEHSGGGRWINRRMDVPPPELQAKRTRTKTTGAGHEQLRTGAVEPTPDDRPAKRVKRGQEPPPDPWQDQPAGQYDETPAEERNGSIDGRQRSIIMAHLGKLRREERLGKLAGLAGREVESTNDLSWVEADRVIKAIEAEAAVMEQDAAAEATP